MRLRAKRSKGGQVRTTVGLSGLRVGPVDPAERNREREKFEWMMRVNLERAADVCGQRGDKHET